MINARAITSSPSQAGGDSFHIRRLKPNRQDVLPEDARSHGPAMLGDPRVRPRPDRLRGLQEDAQVHGCDLAAANLGIWG